MPKCDFNKVAKQHPMPKCYFNIIEIALRHGCSPVNLVHFSEHLFLGTPLDDCSCWVLMWYIVVHGYVKLKIIGACHRGPDTSFCLGVRGKFSYQILLPWSLSNAKLHCTAVKLLLLKYTLLGALYWVVYLHILKNLRKNYEKFLQLGKGE